ncbi:MBL fold metallo-hydrolase [Accumulibacter sp.]|jgi:7,8-dihydropterin-6-yl-methyl-4-(beta-D-ribofuranosyl)aminobenzene 5'-phosphate synthase|uniref:MBL fold metallo-hydrolase n=1 Tax=Accumulibacter sp. TaxID=2053492 RepID=UPI001ACEEE7B|nr:MBL fold metallo-hydrolase [Accumulibacter sp.]MBN8453323.1 MBL fold metallo-hydrolase [Accumulibacter sp.]
MTPVAPPYDIGALRRLRIVCISETGWFDTTTVFDDIRAAGGVQTDQYAIPWPPFGPLHAENAAGFSALLEAETTDGSVRRLLFDTGWNPDWMDRRFAEEGIDRLLQEGRIEALIVSHEHFDHFWGIRSTLRHCPDIPIYLPEGFQPAGLTFIRQQGHTGTLSTVASAQPLVLFPGLAIVSFPMSTLLQVQGENVLYANLEDQGLTMITGCGHGGVLNLLDYARRNFTGGERIHAIYGGLHLSPLEDWDAARDEIVKALAGYGIAKMACNHCTGRTAVEKMLASGLPVLRGTARHGSQTELFLGNGDALNLGGTASD